MAATYHLKVISAYGTFFDGECIQTIIPCEDGTRGILARHDDCIISIVPGPEKTSCSRQSRSCSFAGASYENPPYV